MSIALQFAVETVVDSFRRFSQEPLKSRDCPADIAPMSFSPPPRSIRSLVALAMVLASVSAVSAVTSAETVTSLVLPTRGAQSVGSAEYPVPTGALFVSSASGSDSNPGTASAPLRSVSRAVVNSSSGQTIVLRAGEYHETVDIPRDKALTIQSYPGEAVWFDGSRAVSAWTKTGSTWIHTGWTTQFAHNASFGASGNDPSFINPSYPLAPYPDQIFVDGVALRQVAGASQVTAGTFAVDDANDRLILGSDPTGRAVRVSALENAFRVRGQGSTIRGIGVRRYATPIHEFGAVQIAADDVAIRNLVVRDNASLGISANGKRAVIDHVTVTSSGMLGVHGNNADGVTVSNSVITGNNSERFNETPTAGGLKITKSRDVTVSNNDVSQNLAFGIWLDESIVGFKVFSNRAVGNTAAGIHVEISDTGVVAGNTSLDNREGIFLYNAGNVKVFNNLVAGNRVQDIHLKQDERRQSDTSFIGQDRRYPIPDPAVPWLLRNITIANNLLASGGPRSMWVRDVTGQIDPDTMNISIVGNFLRRPTGNDVTLVWVESGPKYFFDRSAADLASRNPAWLNSESSGNLGPALLIAEAGARHDEAAAIPADVASILGQPAGLRYFGPPPSTDAAARTAVPSTTTTVKPVQSTTTGVPSTTTTVKPVQSTTTGVPATTTTVKPVQSTTTAVPATTTTVKPVQSTTTTSAPPTRGSTAVVSDSFREHLRRVGVLRRSVASGRCRRVHRCRSTG